MNEKPRIILINLLESHGQSLCDDPRRVEALLKDLCPECRREINVLVAALRERIPQEILSSCAVPSDFNTARLVSRLQENLALAEDAAKWAVSSWRTALGLTHMTSKVHSQGVASAPIDQAFIKPAETESTSDERVAGDGDRVTVHYIGTLPNRRVFDRANAENPFTFTIGAQEVLPVIEHQTRGMKVGDKKSFVINQAEAYGPWIEALLITIDRSSFPAAGHIEVGKSVKVAYSGGSERVMKVVEVTDTEVKLDPNHPLAGYNLTYHDFTLTHIE